ncbi:MAG: enoyl-CoA hydratase/isomerase family protein [Anaerolineae bacterium]
MARTKECLLTGASVSAREAERYGLVNRVVAGEELPHALDEAVKRFLAMPASCLLASKRLTTRAFELDFEEFRHRQVAFRACLDSGEHREAMAAYREQRASRKT